MWLQGNTIQSLWNIEYFLREYILDEIPMWPIPDLTLTCLSVLLVICCCFSACSSCCNESTKEEEEETRASKCAANEQRFESSNKIFSLSSFYHSTVPQKYRNINMNNKDHLVGQLTTVPRAGKKNWKRRTRQCHYLTVEFNKDFRIQNVWKLEVVFFLWTDETNVVPLFNFCVIISFLW